MEEETGSEDEGCVLSSAGTRSSLCVENDGLHAGQGFFHASARTHVCVRGCARPPLSSCRYTHSESMEENTSFTKAVGERSLNKTNVCEQKSPGINFGTMYAILFWQ